MCICPKLSPVTIALLTLGSVKISSCTATCEPSHFETHATTQLHVQNQRAAAAAAGRSGPDWSSASKGAGMQTETKTFGGEGGEGVLVPEVEAVVLLTAAFFSPPPIPYRSRPHATTYGHKLLKDHFLFLTLGNRGLRVQMFVCCISAYRHYRAAGLQ